MESNHYPTKIAGEEKEEISEDPANFPTEFAWCESVVEAVLADSLGGSDEEKKTTLTKCVAKLTRMMQLIERMDLYSMNEELEELSTSTLKYLLIPAYLAYLLDAGGLAESNGTRATSLKEAKALYRRFLENLLLFNLIGFNLPWLGEGEDEERGKNTSGTGREQGSSSLRLMGERELLQGAMSARDKKVLRYNQLKALEETRQQLYIEERRNNDEATERELIIVLLRLWSIRAVDGLEAIDRELEVLDYAASLKQSGQPPFGTDQQAAKGSTKSSDQPEKKKIPFYTITKSEEARKRVVGLGYPSVPTLTVNEWFDQMQREKAFGRPMPSDAPSTSSRSGGREHAHVHEGENEDDADEEVAKEREEEEDLDRDQDDPEKRRAQRERDEWRDTHRRGWGNVHNKG